MFETSPEGSISSHEFAQRSESALLASAADIPKSSHYLIGLSGGLDSTALLRVLAPVLLASGASVQAVHIHHGYSGNADEWASCCRAMCDQLNIQCFVERVSVLPDGEGWEAAARKARYRVFASRLPVNGVLLLGHHQDDQLETLVMRVRQRKSIESLAGMPQQRALGRGTLFRPWLGIKRRQIESVAQLRGWSWVEDESNQDARFTRNWVRNCLLPAMREADKEADLLALSLMSAAEKLRSLSDRLVMPFLPDDGITSVEKKIEMGLFLPLSDEGQRLVLRAWFESEGVRQPPLSTFDRIWTELLPAASDATPELRWGAICLRRYAGELHLVSVDETSNLIPAPLVLSITDLPVQISFGSYQLCLEYGGPPAEDLADYLYVPNIDDTIRIAARSGGEKLILKESVGSVPLKKLFALQRVPPWERSVRPLLWLDEKLAWAGPRMVADEFGRDRRDASNCWLSVRLSRSN